MTVSRLQPYAVTIFAEMSALAARTGAVNLGQGFPDEDGPPAMLKVAETPSPMASTSTPPGLGIAPLREAIAAQRKRHFGTDYDPDNEVLVTVGATEAIASAVLGACRARLRGAVDRAVLRLVLPRHRDGGLRAARGAVGARRPWLAIDVDGLRRAVTTEDEALIVNSPPQPHPACGLR